MATFLICGNVCTRNCGFCAVTKGVPAPPDPEEPSRIAAFAKKIGLKHVVITSVTRDDLEDGGAFQFALTVKSLKRWSTIEVLVPDFLGNKDSIKIVIDSRPDIFGHNIETVPSLYPKIRKGADYLRSLSVLGLAKASGLTTKSGIMLGLGETRIEVEAVLGDLRQAGCDIVTIGQYISPSKSNYPVKSLISHEEFDRYKETALKMGFSHCESGTYVRSSYMANSGYRGQGSGFSDHVKK